MASVNKIILVGNLTRDPETRFTQNGAQITTVSLATNETWKDANGQKQERVEFWNVTFFSGLAKIAGDYLRKGQPVYIEGSGRTEKYTDKDGVERRSFQVTAREMQMLGNRSGGSANFNDAPQKAERKPLKATQQAPSDYDEFDQNIPF